MTERKILTGAGSGHYITFSTYGRRKLLSTPRERQVVISALDRLEKKDKVKVSGFVIMPDHVHLMVWFDDDRGLSSFMQTFKRVSSLTLKPVIAENSSAMVENITRREGEREFGSVWQKRYYDFNIFTEEKWREKLNYMHQNPVKKDLCEKPEDWRWSSASWYLKGRSVGVRITPGF